MRVHPTSFSADLPGVQDSQDLVLQLDAAHALDVPAGAAADDYLDGLARRQLDEAAIRAVARWRQRFDGPLTVDGVCLPFVNEAPLMRTLVSALRAGAGLKAAVERNRPRSLVLAGGDRVARGLVEAVAAGAGIPAVMEPGPPNLARPTEGPPQPLVKRARQRAFRAVVRLGAPSVLRRGGVLALSYWPLIPLLDRLLEDPDVRVAIALEKPATGPRRSLRAMADGGWLGQPGPLARRQARRRLGPALEAAYRVPAPTLSLDGVEMGEAVQPALLEQCARDGAEQLATGWTVQRAYRRGQPRLVLATYTTDPFPRLVISLARDAGIRTFVLTHGAYLMPQTMTERELVDEVAIYSEAAWFQGIDPRVHVVGYPLPHVPAPPRTSPPPVSPRIVVLGQNGHPWTCQFDERIVLRHYVVALRALEAAIPEAEVVLRPHPLQDLTPIRAMLGGSSRARVSIDAATPLDELMRSADLCLGSLSTATLQAALAGTPVAVLNVTGFDWKWPLGGETPVRVTRSADELAGVLQAWRREGWLPGHDALVSALGADRPGAVERLADLVAAAARRREAELEQWSRPQGSANGQPAAGGAGDRDDRRSHPSRGANAAGPPTYQRTAARESER